MIEKEDLLDILVEKSGKTKEEIETLLNEKINELSGLVTYEGAAHILANELGFKLENSNPKTSTPLFKISEIKEPKIPVSLHCKVIRKYDRVEFSNEKGTAGSVQSLLVGDESGIIRVVFWNDSTELLENIQEGDILLINNAYTRENNNSERIEIHFGQYSNLEVNPEGVEINLPEYKRENIEFEEKKIKDLSSNDKNVRISGIIVDFDQPRHYLACPYTLKKVTQDEGKYFSPTKGEVEPIKIPIVKLKVSDDSGEISVVGFRDRAEAITNLNSEELINLVGEEFEEFKKKIIKTKIEIGGNITENSFSQDFEMVVNQVFNIEDINNKIKEENENEEFEEDINAEETIQIENIEDIKEDLM